MTRPTGRWCRPLAAAMFVAAAIACAGPSASSAAGVSAGLQPSALTVAPGDTFTVELAVAEAGDEFNAFDAAIRFDPARLEFVPTAPLGNQRGALMLSACTNTFHLFNARPDSLAVTLSLLCNQTFVTGPGTVYQVRFRALPGTAVTTIAFGPSTVFYRAGFLVLPLTTGTMSVTIGSPSAVPGGPARAGARLSAPHPNPARGAGAVEFELDVPGHATLELLDVQGRRIALLADGSFPAGRRAVALAGGWPAGVYRLRLTTGGGGVSERRWVVLR